MNELKQFLSRHRRGRTFAAVLLAALLLFVSCAPSAPEDPLPSGDPADVSGPEGETSDLSSVLENSSEDPAVSGPGESEDISGSPSEDGSEPSGEASNLSSKDPGETSEVSRETSRDTSHETSKESSEDTSKETSRETSGEQPHVHAYVQETVPADCTHQGRIIYRCSCGASYFEILEPLGHDFQVKETTATCEEDGVNLLVCSRCGEEISEEAPASGHSFVNLKSELREEGKTYVYTARGDCSVCGKKGLDAGEYEIGPAVALNADAPAQDLPGDGGTVRATKAKDGTVTLTATADKYYDFLQWSDGNKKAERAYGGDGSVSALFACRTNRMAVLNVHTENAEMITHTDYYLNAEFALSGCDEEHAFSGKTGKIRVRGNASSNYGDPEYAKTHKVHYRIKFDKKQEMLGLNGGAACKSWVLLRGDTAFVRETSSFWLFDQIAGGKYYSSDYTFVQLYINGEYYGAYVLCEHTQIQKNRISITEKKDEDTELRTGYLIEIDNYTSKEPYAFALSFGGKVLTDPYGVERATRSHGYSVKYDKMTSAQLSFVKKYISNVNEVIYRAIYNNEFYTLDENNNLVKDTTSKDAKECISRVFDLDAAAAMYITREVACERDGGCGSFYMYVDFTAEQPKLTFCAPWDFSWAYSTTQGFDIDHLWVSAWQPDEFVEKSGDRSFNWFILLYKGEFFQQMVRDAWADMHARNVQEGLLKEIDRISEEYAKEFQWNASRWTVSSQKKAANDIRSFLKQRMEWLDTQWS